MQATAFVRRALAAGALAVLALAVPAPAAGATVAAAATPAVSVAETVPGHPVPSLYNGFSIDPGNLCDVVRLGTRSAAFRQLFLDLGPGVIRVGGNTGDRRASWSETDPADCTWYRVRITPALVDGLFAFARSVGYLVVWQVPLDNGHPDQDVAEAQYVSAQQGLIGLEIGNEPNYYPDATTKYQTYLDEWNAIYHGYRDAGGTVPVSGPATMYGASFYAQPFLSQHHGDISAVSMHHYVGKSTTNPTCTSLLALNGLQNLAAGGVATANSYGLPFVINETNTYTHYGKQGVSNAFCSALWAADFMAIGLNNGVQGMYFHGVDNYQPGNSNGAVQCYTPINNDGTPAPQYYGLLYHRQLTRAGGDQVGTSSTNASLLDPSAVMGGDGALRVSVVNRNAAARTVTVTTQNAYASASSITLRAPSPTATAGVTLGGRAIAADGTWSGTPVPVPVTGRTLRLSVPAYSAVLVTYTSV